MDLQVQTRLNLIYICMLSMAIVGLMFWLNGNVNFNLGDEGHLWYGVVQTIQGAVPIRDFRSYDPGRYYWAAAWASIFGDGVLALRFSGSIFLAAGLALVLLKIRHVVRDKAYIPIIGLVLVLLAFPVHKVYEHSLAMAAIFFAAMLIEDPSIKRHLSAGIFVGLSACVARNYGGYFFITFLFLIPFIGLKKNKASLANGLAIWFLGVVIGYLPIIAMTLVIPGFAASFFDSIYLLFGPYAPVLPKPIPWVWHQNYGALPISVLLRSLSVSVLYLILPLFYLCAMIWAFKLKQFNRSSGLLIASVFVGIPIIHHIITRADVEHLAQGIHPFVVSLLIVPLVMRGNRHKVIGLGLTASILTLTLSIALQYQLAPIKNKLAALFSNNPTFVDYQIKDSNLWIPKWQADYMDYVKTLIGLHEKQGENTWIAPYEPGFYPILGKKLPVWDPFPLFPVDEKRQKHLIEALYLKTVNVVLISNRPLDGMNERRFSRTHPLVWKHIMDAFVPVDAIHLQREQVLLRRRGT